MTLTKGMKIRKTTVNQNNMFANTTANSVLVYEVVKVNRNTYGIKCVEGYMNGSESKLCKDFPEEIKDVYGTITRWEIVA